MKRMVLAAVVLAVSPAKLDAQQEALGKPWKRVMQTDETHTVFLNACEALDTTPTPIVGVTVLATPTVASGSPTPTPDAAPGNIVIQSGVDFCPTVAANPNECPVVSSGTKNCVKVRLQPAAGATPAASRNGNVYQVHINAATTSGDRVSGDLRLDVQNRRFTPN